MGTIVAFPNTKVKKVGKTRAVKERLKGSKYFKSGFPGISRRMFNVQVTTGCRDYPSLVDCALSQNMFMATEGLWLCVSPLSPAGDSGLLESSELASVFAFYSQITAKFRLELDSKMKLFS